MIESTEGGMMSTGRARRGKPAASPLVSAAETPIFDDFLVAAQRTRPEDLLTVEDLDRRRPVTDEERAIADTYLAAFDRLETEQAAEVTDAQAHVLNVILVAAHHLFCESPKPLAAWSIYSGLPEEEIRAAETALREIGLTVQQPTQSS
jgi:hypothetical protein